MGLLDLFLLEAEILTLKLVMQILQSLTKKAGFQLQFIKNVFGSLRVKIVR